jgi:hypothetical protein
MERLLRRPLALVVALGAALLAVGGIAWAAIPDSSGAVNVCSANANGKLRAVDSPADCGGNETAIALGGPTRAYSSHPGSEVTLGTTSTDVASLTLPAGRYLVHAKVNVVDFGFTGNVFVACSLQAAGLTPDQTWVTLGPAIESAPSASVGLQASISLASATTVAARCAVPDGDPDVRARFRALDAVSVDAVVAS